MSTTASTSQGGSHTLPKEYRQPVLGEPNLAETIDEVLKRIAAIRRAVWPLKDYVAVNPFAGLAPRSFLDARACLRVFSDCETLMPVEFYARQFEQGTFTLADIHAASAENQAQGLRSLPAELVVEQLQLSLAADNQQSRVGDGWWQPNPENSRRLRTLSECIDRASGSQWSELICEEISKHCSNHYDQGQAAWANPWVELPLYQAWHQAAEHDRNIELLGLPGFRKYVASLPHTAEASIVVSLHALGVPEAMWDSLLLCHAFSTPGWSSWTRYQTEEAKHLQVQRNDFAGLLAMRLAYEAFLAQTCNFSVDWRSFASATEGQQATSFNVSDSALLRFTLLRASEIAYRDRLLTELARPTAEVVHAQDPSAEQSVRKLAQCVFCIDVRSERFRRHLEQQTPHVETFGFAGFFGISMEYVALGQTCGDSHVPVLLRPQFQVHQGVHNGCEHSDAVARQKVSDKRSWSRLWSWMPNSASACFSFVETTGWLYGFKLLAKTSRFARKVSALPAMVQPETHPLGPTLRGLNAQGLSTSKQADLAQGVLTNLGLTDGFARLVVLCGHASQTENNPLKAGLDCGACGGHSGEPNARFAASLLNQPHVRSSLADRGILIPEDTFFVGGLHNTTTDQVELFDTHELPQSHQSDVRALQEHLAQAGQLTAAERKLAEGSSNSPAFMRRAEDWSEVRPEWGLAGNAAFIAAPRSLTQHMDLQGRAFLHSYDQHADPDGKVLELIMTAPMIVANWINMQYYASTVDNAHFGAGNKTVHNVVGQFGILSGNGGDLQTGLPWQSLHDGQALQHAPQRLQVVIAASRSAIERVIDKHQSVADLLTNGWLHLVAIEDGVLYRYTTDACWEDLHTAENAEFVCA